ncbi:MAG: hypothetical protein BWY76_02016 [bacterium ADurb.Bin429]|nr:MAG: hypothetical protein BWY76_02016 [bacterium ADurb.Bin429]
MSFDVFFQRFQQGDVAPADREAARRIIETIPRTCPFTEEPDSYRLAFPDGGEADLSSGLASEDFTGCSLTIRTGISPNLVAFIYELAVTCDFVVMMTAENPVILLNEAQRVEVPADGAMFEEAIICASFEEFEPEFLERYGGWRDYRDYVITAHTPE